MTLPFPPNLERREAFAPLLSLLRDTLAKPKDLAARWGLGENHMAALRRRNAGVPYVKLPTGLKGKGAIRYRVSEIIAAELAGQAGGITLERVCLVIAAEEGLSEAQRAKLIARLRAALC